MIPLLPSIARNFGSLLLLPHPTFSLPTDFPISNKPFLVFINEKYECQMYIPQFNIIKDIPSPNLKYLTQSMDYALLILETIANAVLKHEIFHLYLGSLFGFFISCPKAIGLISKFCNLGWDNSYPK